MGLMFTEEIFKICLAGDYGHCCAPEFDQVDIVAVRAAQDVSRREDFNCFRAESYPDVFLFSFWLHGPGLCGSCFLITNQEKVCIMKNDEITDT